MVLTQTSLANQEPQEPEASMTETLGQGASMCVQMHKDLHRYVHSGVPKFKSTDFRAHTHTH